MYAKLISKTKPEKAINILKCLAKVYPPLPFSVIPYTKTLKQAKSMKDLKEATTKAISQSGSYNYTNYKNSQVGLEAYIETCVTTKAPKYPTPEVKLFSRKISVNERFHNLTIITEFGHEKRADEMPINIPKKGMSYVFPIYSNPKFLY